MTGRLARAFGRQQPQFSRALHGRGAMTNLKLGVKTAKVRADRVQRDGQFACEDRLVAAPDEPGQHVEDVGEQRGVCGRSARTWGIT